MEFEQRFFQLCRNFSTKLSKLNITCPEEHFYKNIMLTLWNNFRLWARKCLICCGNFAALLSNQHFCLRMGNWKNSFERIFNFSDFFSDVQGTFLGFCVVSFQAWWSKLNSTSQDEHIHQEKIGEKTFYPFRTMSAFFWTFIEVF